MLAIFWRKLKKNGLMILGWGIGLAALGYLLFNIYDRFFLQNVDLQQIMGAFPEEVFAFFGDADNIFDLEGYLTLEFFSYVPIILGIMAVSSAGSLIAKGEEEGTLEVILAQPVSRTAVFWSKLAALLVSLGLILAITWGGFALGYANTSSFDVSYLSLVNPFISLFAILLVFLSLALMLSMILPSSGAAGLVAGFLLVASYFITSLARIDSNLEGVNRFSPMQYYQSGGAISGLDWNNLIILFAISAVFIALAWVLFERRDLRFGGSGGFRLAVRKKGME
jgi:ABC-2 type transport system permease protein